MKQQHDPYEFKSTPSQEQVENESHVKLQDGEVSNRLVKSRSKKVIDRKSKEPVKEPSFNSSIKKMRNIIQAVENVESVVENEKSGNTEENRRPLKRTSISEEVTVTNVKSRRLSDKKEDNIKTGGSKSGTQRIVEQSKSMVNAGTSTPNVLGYVLVLPNGEVSLSLATKYLVNAEVSKF